VTASGTDPRWGPYCVEKTLGQLTGGGGANHAGSVENRIPYVNNVTITDDKIFKHLLVSKPVNDKSGLMADMGFNVDHPDELKGALLKHVRENPVTGARKTKTGTSHEVTGPLDTPAGQWNDIITAW
jgi:hypothetical protein